ncbi:MAG: hypothetical protein AAFZ80_06945 [Cyanobacteria bacterium P01_A01_bin.105]
MTNTQMMSDNLKQIKTEGGQRSQQIGKIFRAAFTEAAAEVKAGGQTVRPLAKELADVVAETAKFKGQEVRENVRQAFTETAVDEKDFALRLQLKLTAIFKAIRDTLGTSWNRGAEASVLPVEKETAAETHSGVTVETLAA